MDPVNGFGKTLQSGPQHVGSRHQQLARVAEVLMYPSNIVWSLGSLSPQGLTLGVWLYVCYGMLQGS